MTPAAQRAQAPLASTRAVLGSGPDLVRDLVGTFTRAWRQHGDIVRFKIPGKKDLFLVTHPDYVKHVLEDRQSIYPKDPLSVGKFEPFVGLGLFTSNGEFHFRHRRLAQPAFKGSRIGGFGPVMVASTTDLVEEWRTHARGGDHVDITPEMMRLALTIVMRTLFSTDVSDRAAGIAAAVRTCNSYTNARLQRFVELPGRIPTPSRRRFDAALRLLDDFVYGLIAERRRSVTVGDDLLSLFLAARDDESGYRMSDKQVRDEVVTIFLGGYETTALSLVWTFSLLARHPDVERQVRAEITEVVGDREPTAEDLPHLRYTRMMFSEVLRLYPSVWTMSRTPLVDDEIGGFPVPRGSQIFISPYLVHRHPAIWDDPEQFRPERFAKGAGAGRPLYGYIPFSRGPRLCPGSSVALLEGPLVIARILQAYRLSLAPGHVCLPTSNVFLYPRGGMPMRIEAVDAVSGGVR